MSVGIHGLVTGVRAQILGDVLTATATTGDTVLHVNDVADFSEDGGFFTMPGLTFGGLQLFVAYSGIDDDANTISLAFLIGSAGSPFPAGTEVYVWDNANGQPATRYYATVDSIDGFDGDPVEAVVDQSLAASLAQTMRTSVGESVTLTRDGSRLRVTDVHGRNNALGSLQYLQGGMTTRQNDTDAGVDILGVDSGTPGVYLYDDTGDQLAQITADGIATDDPSSPRITISNSSDPLFSQGGLIAFYVVGASWTPGSIFAGWSAGPPNLGTLSISGPEGPSGSGAASLGLSYATGGTGSIANLDGKTINIGATATSITVHDDLAVTGAVAATGVVTGTTIHSSATTQTDTGFFDNSLSGAGSTTTASINTSGKFIRTPSSKRYKSNIKPLSLDEARKVLDLEPVTFTLKEEARLKGRRTYPGFIAEQAADVGAELWVDRDSEGNPDGFRYPETSAPFVLLLRELYAKNADQEARIATLEAAVAALTKEG